MKLAGKVTLVTGGGRGIGEAICVAYGSEGAAVAVADLDTDGARRVVERIRSAGGTASAVEVDVARSESIDAMAKSVLREHGRIDVLVNNAGGHRSNNCLFSLHFSRDKKGHSSEASHSRSRAGQ